DFLFFSEQVNQKALLQQEVDLIQKGTDQLLEAIQANITVTQQNGTSTADVLVNNAKVIPSLKRCPGLLAVFLHLVARKVVKSFDCLSTVTHSSTFLGSCFTPKKHSQVIL